MHCARINIDLHCQNIKLSPAGIPGHRHPDPWGAADLCSGERGCSSQRTARCTQGHHPRWEHRRVRQGANHLATWPHLSLVCSGHVPGGLPGRLDDRLDPGHPRLDRGLLPAKDLQGQPGQDWWGAYASSVSGNNNNDNLEIPLWWCYYDFDNWQSHLLFHKDQVWGAGWQGLCSPPRLRHRQEGGVGGLLPGRLKRVHFSETPATATTETQLQLEIFVDNL